MAEGSEGLQPVSVEVPEDPLEGGDKAHAQPQAVPGEEEGVAGRSGELPVTVKASEPSSKPEEEEGGEGFSSLSGQIMDLSKPRVIADGLKLKLQSQNTVLQSFSYALFPSMSQSSPVGWQYLVTEDEEAENIRLHELVKGEGLGALLEGFKQSYAKAAVLVNMEDSYEVAEEFLSGVKEVLFPLVVVRKSDGEEIMRCLERHAGDSVYARVDAENQVDGVDKLPQPVADGATQKAEPQSSITFAQRVKNTFGVQSKRVSELRAEVKRLMFTVAEKTPIVMAEDSSKFMLVMSAFHNYEKATKRDNVKDIGDVVKKLRTHYAAVLKSDFPFYLLLAYRMHRKMHKYDCDDVHQFITMCVRDFELKLMPKTIAHAILSFIHRGDFSVVFNPDGDEDRNCSVFHILEQACFELAEVSYKINNSRIAEVSNLSNGHRPLYRNFLYSRMLWVSLGMKFHEARKVTVTRNTQMKWRDYLLKFRHRIVLAPETITELKAGLEVGRLLELPFDLSCNYRHLGDLLASDNAIRPFQELKNCLVKVEAYVPSGTNLLTMLTEVRAVYDMFLKPPDINKLKVISGEGTLTSSLHWGIRFVDTVYTIFTKREMSQDHVDSEMQRWLELLLQLVNITGPNPAQHLGLFLQSKHDVLRKYRHISQKFIVQATQQHFSDLSIQQFFQLYKAFRIWSNKHLHEFLKVYQIPSDVKLSDPTWKQFFAEVVTRFKSARLHYYLADFLRQIGQKYRETKRPVDFLIDLLKLRVENLLSVDNDEDHESQEIRTKFSNYLHEYISRNALRHGLLAKMTGILTSISDDRDEFQLLVLDVLRREVVPELRTNQNRELDANFRTLLEECLRHLRSNLGWLTSFSTKQRFCWGILATCCTKMTISVEHFDWAHNYSAIIQDLKLGMVFLTYCTGKKLGRDQRIIADKLPEEILAHPSEDLHRYFEWVADIQRVLRQWKENFQKQDITFNDVLLYASNHVKLLPMGETICAASLLVDFNDVLTVKTTFLHDFETLNALLLRYIPGQPDAKWCSLPSLLEEYGVCLPQKARTLISNKVSFPGPGGQIPEDLLGPPLHPSTTGMFLPGHDISLKLHKNMTLKELSILVSSVNAFQQFLLDYLTMLVFFKLNKSVLFDKYLRHHLKRFADSPHDTMSPKEFPFSGFPSHSANFPPSLAASARFGSFAPPMTSFAPPSMMQDPAQGLTTKIFVSALKATSNLIHKLMQGTATYSEIIAEDELMLQQLDIEREFAILSSYGQMSNHPHQDGLDGVQSMLELFQYAAHIKNLWSVCHQYHLKECTADPLLVELMELVGDHVGEENRSKMTPLVAMRKMKRVKEILCMTEKKSSKCLDIFAAMEDSAAFYQFVRDKQFYGQQGQAIFLQQYQLITAQLQHEEYDEQVLNHLFAAFKVISPFMDAKKSLTQLMMEVTALNTVNGLKQLETVNANITLIRLWFSRAEGDTLQNVAQELDCIISTGEYTFLLGGDQMGSVEGQLFLEYEPSSAQLLPQELGEPRTMFAESQPGAPARVRREKWNSEQIRDFVRKLGFMDQEKEGGHQIKNFLHLNQTVSKLLELYLKLRELGHPLFLTEGHVPPMPCSKSKEEVDGEVQQMQLQVTKWSHEVSDLRARYTWLLYFSVPKMLLLYRLIQSPEMWEMERIVHEVSFLVLNQPEERESLMEGVENTLRDTLMSADASSSPMLVVGQFLDTLLQDHTLPRRCSVKDSMSLPRHLRSVSSHFAQPLYSCPTYSQMDFLRLILNIFSGVPGAYQVLRCQASTTEEELSLFLKRVGQHHAHYLMLGVNRLPFKLQENLVQVHLGMQRSMQQADLSAQATPPTIHFVETAPSMLREMPWILPKDSKDYRISVDEAKKLCTRVVVKCHDFSCIQIVYGMAGNGKTHYIKKQLANCSEHITIAVNEAFSPLTAIKKLRSLPLYKRNIGLFFNFTILPPGDSVANSEKSRYSELMEVIGWFFFDLFLLGYVEDSSTGLSFCLPGGLQWAVYIEVPSRDRESVGESLKLFYHEVPALQLLGSPQYIHPDIPYAVDADVQLVCKYLQAYKLGTPKRIDRQYREGGQQVKFSADPDLSEEECHRLLQEFMPKHIASTKITQQLFIRYMKRRCDFLDRLPAFNYNTGSAEYLTNEFGVKTATNTQQLGSTLMHTMLNEVNDFCDPSIKENWSLKAHQQLIYDFKDGGASLGLISLQPSQLREVEKAKFKKIGVTIPSMAELYSRDLLDSYLSRALNVELENGRLTVIDDSAYVLTLDYTIKMLNIHERFKCGVPVIIEGETGVGKTALVEMLSKLWNQSLLLEWRKQRSRLLEFFQRKLSEIPGDTITDNYQACLQAVESMSSGEASYDSLLLLCNHSDTHGKFYSQLKEYLRPMRNDPVVPLLVYQTHHQPMEELFAQLELDDSPDTTARLLHAILLAQVEPTFHKINVHAAMSPAEVRQQFEPVFKQARLLQETHQQKLQRIKSDESIAARRRESATSRRSIISSTSSASSSVSESEEAPFVTVFLDEVNTSSCLGLFKEILVDRSFDGMPIPDNVFMVAACNPHRGNSLASHKTWVRGTYYVRSLHPTLKFLMWDYGSLDEHQERDYINAKMKMINRGMPNPEIASLTDLIITSQSKMRDFAFRQLKDQVKTKTAQIQEQARISSRSCVSQRDIQRVFTFYQWFKAMYDRLKPHGEERMDYHRRAVLVALGLVYYMRLNAEFRKEYCKYLDDINRLPNEVTFSRAFEEELDYYIGEVELPKGIARTLALKENLFATIICTVTHTPLIIVGAPGSSKTLSFNQTIANLKGQESKKALFRNMEIFHSLDPHYYQCSRRTTSNEIQTVFSRAVNRQRSHQRFSLPIYCVVFMDEAGLPEESHESLKVLHYHLDKQEVSFVAITNHVLDAAKTNRAISLFRPDASDEDLETLAKGCLCSNPEDPPPELRRDLDMVVKFCQPYSECMKSSRFSSFFGLRDFIQFVNYLRRKRDEKNPLSAKLVMQALERNFNGFEEFESICRKFLQVIPGGVRLEDVPQRRILEVLRDSMQDRPQAMQDLTENEVRYKLLIDPSEDDSLVRLLFSFGVLERENTRMFVCSDFPGDGQLQKIHTIAAIRHSAIEGHTAVLSQTDDIHESFYDLFNQRFRRIDDPEHGARYYTNIAIGAHLKPSRVHPNFQCVVVLKKSEVDSTPAPFLNRFEKYLISHGSLLETVLQSLPPCMAIMIRAARKKVDEFICGVFGYKSLYGLQPETLDSLILDLLPPLSHTYQRLGEDSMVDDTQEVSIYLIQEVLNALRSNAGFDIPKYPLYELKVDTAHVFSLIVCDPTFEGVLQNLTHQDAMQAVTEALNLLYSAPGPQEDGGQLDLTPEGCMVVSVLQQVLVRLLTKKLMNLMTTEAVILNRNKIPFSYLENYLSNQAHFSLKEAISNYHIALRATLLDPSRSPNKVVFFTRSSPLVHALPSQFPLPATTEVQQDPDALEMTVGQIISEDTETVGKLVFEETGKLMVHKLSNLASQSSVQELLRDFVSSDSAEVCVLLANMQETTCKTINHIRVMIEEAELRTPPGHCKVFVLLLHFPPAQFFQHCYPALFLKGWDHCYLDTVAHSTVKGVVDIQDWFFKCCFQAEDPDSGEPDTLLQALSDLLPQTISVVSARVYFGNKKDGSFNSTMNATQRSHALKTLLFERGMGRVLCEKFRAYWKPKVMAEYLERAATFSKQRESTLNITDSIQTQFKALFMDFCVYMLTRANENFNLDTVYAQDASASVQNLFIDIFRIFPVPKLHQLKLLSNNLPGLQPPAHCPKFPFFSTVCEQMERQTDLCGEAVNLQLDVLADHTHQEGGPMDSLADGRPPSNPTANVQALITAVLEDLEPQLQVRPRQVVGLAVEAMAGNQNLWQCYFIDFITHKLKLVDPSHTPQGHTPQGDLAQQILHTYFEQLHFCDMPQRVVQLHCWFSVYHLFLAQMATILRPLSKIEGLQQQGAIPSPSSSAEQLLNAVRLTNHPLGTPSHLSSFVINTLFNALMAAAFNSSDAKSTHNKLAIWFRSYRDVMTLPTLKQYIYYSFAVPEPGEASDGAGSRDGSMLMEAMMNVTQATFVTLQTAPTLDSGIFSKGHQTFFTLFSRYFKETMKDSVGVFPGQTSDSSPLQSPAHRPSLAGVMEVTVEILSASDFNAGLHRCSTPVRLVMEGLLAHFFSSDRPSYVSEDVLWFLKLANQQDQWCCNPFQGEEDNTEVEISARMAEMSVGVVAGGLEDDLISKLERSTLDAEKVEEEEFLPPPGALEMSLFKFYLGRILGNYQEQVGSEPQPESGPLLMYQQKFRSLVGEVLMQSQKLGAPGPYIPLFYQMKLTDTTKMFAENGRMQQPLCHLYFLTVMEHLWSEHHYNPHTSKLSTLVRSAVNVQKALETAQGGEAVLLWVELQAVVQVLIQELALHLNPSQAHKLGDVQLIVEDLNKILDNPAMGGGMAQGHGMVLALHLMKLLKSSRRFTDLMTKKFDAIKNITCLKSIHQELQSPPELKPHLFPFMHPGAEGEVSSLYRRVSTCMLAIHSGSQEPSDLIHIAQHCMEGLGTTNKRYNFRMVLWLASYYDFYDKKIISPLLCNVMGGQEMSNYLREEGYIRLVQCFLHPSLMVHRKESPNPLTEQHVLELGVDGRPQVIQRQGTYVDPLYQLFVPDQPEEQDQSELDLRHSLANLVAVILGSPSRSNHLWYHLFAADRLENSYMTGFMYNATVHHDGLLYDCGVELSPEGQFGRQDYKKHACRGTYTLHSLYLLLWANFGSFCMALLTQPDSDQRIHGNIISEWLSIRHYCVSQLRTLWMHIRNNLGLSEEQRSFFIMRAMTTLYQLLSRSRPPPASAQLDAMTPDTLQGIFKTQQELDHYETMWHMEVYQPTWDEQATKFIEFSNQHQNQLFSEIRRLDVRYPHFPSEQELTHCILSAGDLRQHSEGGKLWLLSRLSMEWACLQVGGALLPSLVEFYRWLHLNLGHLLTYDQASSITIGRVLALAERNLGKEMGAHIRSLYERVKVHYNRYVELIGGAIGAGACAAVRRGNRIFTIADDIPLLHFLSDVEEEEQGNDWLYIVIADIVTSHNHAIENLYSMIQAKKQLPLNRLLPEEPPKIFPMEVALSNAIISDFSELHGVNSFLQLMRSRYQPTSQDQPTLASSALVSLSWSSLHPRRQMPAFQLDKLEEDFVSAFISGKPLIEAPSQLRKVFPFKKDEKVDMAISQDIIYTAADLQDMTERLPDSFKLPLPDPLMKRFEYEFHSADYHLMIEVVTALRTVAGHLVKALDEGREDYGDLETATAPEFMLNLYEHLKKDSDVLYEIGVQNASPSHLRCLADLPLTATYSCLRLFFRWVEEGFYDFSTLPFPFKVHLSYQDQVAIEQLRLKWSSTLSELVKELQQLVDVLKHSEQDITSRVNEAVNKPILDYLIEYHMLQEEEDLITRYIPRTIMLHHYVEFRLALRRLQLKVHREVEEDEKGRRTVDIWSEFVADLWEKHLPHLREELYGEGLFVYNPNTGCYGFQEEEEEDEASYDEVMAALLREAAEEDGEQGQGFMDSGSFKLQPASMEESFAVISEGVSGHTYDLDQPSSEEEREEEQEEEGGREGAVDGAEVSALPDGLEERLKADPDLKKKVLSMVQSIGRGSSLPSLARRITPDGVADFLTRIDLPQYAQTFKDSDISGELLLEADSEILLELGVSSPLHQMKIMQLFRRELQGSIATYSRDHMGQFLQQYKLSKYAPTLEGHGIDGDMILEVEEKLMKSVLREVGVTSLVDILKIRSKYKTFVSDEP